MPEIKDIPNNFMDLVAKLDPMKLDKLYENPLICEAILRSLPPLAKKYVLQMLYMDAPLPAKLLEEWVLPEGATKHADAIKRLITLKVFTATESRKKETSYRLNSTFQTSLQQHLIHGGVLPREPMPANVIGKPPGLEELEAYALGRWECFLLNLISSGQSDKPGHISVPMMRYFQQGLLTQRGRDDPKLTESGFQFLLMDTNAQLWYIMREYIDYFKEDQGEDTSDLIAFLLELSFHTTGEAYSINTLTEDQKSTIKDLADLGLIKLQQGMKDSWFIPTKLVTNLLSLTDSSTRKEGFLLVETNFRIYAYSTSKLHVQILRLFSRIEYQLPNLIVAALTKESLYTAFESGISSEHIVSFLQQNAHPRVAEKIPSVPENVTDQIRLWESDLNRVVITPSHYYDGFPSRDVFEAASNFAREKQGLLWEDSKTERLVVTEKVHDKMREFLRGQK